MILLHKNTNLLCIWIVENHHNVKCQTAFQAANRRKHIQNARKPRQGSIQKCFQHRQTGGPLENTAKYKNAANIDKAAGKYHKTQLLKFKLAAYP